MYYARITLKDADGHLWYITGEEKDGKSVVDTLRDYKLIQGLVEPLDIQMYKAGEISEVSVISQTIIW